MLSCVVLYSLFLQVDDVKVKSAQLLAVALLHGEHSITMHLEKILPTMYRAIIDTDTRVSENVKFHNIPLFKNLFKIIIFIYQKIKKTSA